MTEKLTDIQLLVLEKAHIECSDVEQLLYDYVENELPSSLRARLDAHMKKCEVCEEVLDTYQYTIALARALGRNPRPVPVRAQNRLRAALNQRLGLEMAMVD